MNSRDADIPLAPKAAALLIGLEKYALPLLYAFLAYRQFQYIESQSLAWNAIGRWHSMPAFSHGVYFADMTKHLLIFALMAFAALTLLLSRPPVTLPDKLKHVTVPLAVSYYFVLYGAVDYCPRWLRENLMPPAWRYPSAILGLIFSIVGYSNAVWAMVYLRRSFAIFVSVRDVVLSGPYRFVRHPIYLGYLLDLAGLLLAAASIGMLSLGLVFVLLLILRARIEEEKLAEANSDYQRYLARTGFILPRFRTDTGSPPHPPQVRPR